MRPRSLVRGAICAGLFAASTSAFAQRQVVALWPGGAPGSESWTQSETESPAPWDVALKVVRNVVRPTLTVYRPDRSVANGTAVVVAPGGGFRFLTWAAEGTQVAEWLAGHGVTAFVLKYRLIDTGASEEEFQANAKAMFTRLSRVGEPGAGPVLDPEMQNLAALAGEDGRQAVRVVRRRAAEWAIAVDRIGLMGFSAGALVTADVALRHDAESRPDFVAPIYGAPFQDVTPPDRAPPMFVVCADDDRLAAAPSERLYRAWHDAGQPVELHMYSKGGHGFGMQKRGLPVDGWIERFGDWLQVQGFLKAAH